ncbi:MAG: FAD-dependent oxidoreductase, partial [Pseudomonadota bacterium]
DYAVIGKGMIGSAAARYLSKTSNAVVLIGPDEPMGDWATHDGVFASHYDQGRVTRCMDGSLAWALWATRSIAAYPEIEAQSGIQFHYRSGGVHVGYNSADPASNLNRVERIAHQLGTADDRYTSEAFRKGHPQYHFDDGLIVLHETGEAGYINPRSLVAAQVKIAEAQGADVVRETVMEIDTKGEGVTLTTNGGQTIRAKRVLVAAGAWTEYLTGAELGILPTPRTITLAQIDSAETERLKNMPTIIWQEGLDNPDIEYIYVLPPIEYPDGNTYIKLGGSLRQNRLPQSARELNRWFQGSGSSVEARALEHELRRVIPGLRTESVHSRTCVVTRRADENLPLVKPIVAGKVMVATAGCGAAAKSSDEIGRLAALQLKKL